jgi:hypothetical protein
VVVALAEPLGAGVALGWAVLTAPLAFDGLLDGLAVGTTAASGPEGGDSLQAMTGKASKIEGRQRMGPIVGRSARKVTARGGRPAR